jgi:hypothetical protein
VRNVLLHEALREYCKATLTMLKEKLKGTEGFPTGIKEKFEISESGGFSQSYVTEVEWYRLIYRFEEEFKRLDAYQAAVQAMEQDEKISRHLNTLVGTAKTKTTVDCDTCLRSLLIQLLEGQKDLDFQEEQFDRICDQIEDYFYREILEYRYLSPLEGFQMEAERIELNPKFSIIRIPKEEKQGILSESSYSFLTYLSYQAVYFTDYAFEYYLEEPKVFGDATKNSGEALPDRVVMKNFDEACSSLRLFKKGKVGYTNIRRKAKFWEPHSGTVISSLPGREVLGTEYVLSKGEILTFLDFWRVYQTGRHKEGNRIEIALRRFNFAYGKVMPEDKLIDYIIGFEALLLQDEPQELPYRMALRGAALLSKNPDERKKTFSELKAAYKERNNIVHGRKARDIVHIGNEEVQFTKFVERIEEYLRLAIKEFLVLCGTKSEKQIIEALEEKILVGCY